MSKEKVPGIGIKCLKRTTVVITSIASKHHLQQFTCPIIMVGGTNGKGDVLSGAYALTDQSTIKVTYYNVEKNSDNLASPFVFGNPGTDYDHDTIQVDMNFKYK